jgi:hypothetical protein
MGDNMDGTREERKVCLELRKSEEEEKEKKK